jgi:hypothetical protein
VKIFLSWSKERSKVAAQVLRDWLPEVIQSIEPWMSTEDIEAGARWGIKISDELSKTKFGIICITPENQNAPWILFEAGALAKTLENTYVCPYLIGLTPSQLQRGPLTQFQAKQSNKQQTLELVKTINRALVEESLPDDRLVRIFERWWPDLDKAIKEIPEPENNSEVKRSMEDMMEELLILSRNIANLQDDHYSLTLQEHIDSPTIIRAIFNTMSPKEERILRLRFGLGETKSLSLKEIASVFGSNTATISQIEYKAIRKIFDFFEHHNNYESKPINLDDLPERHRWD